jgi:hypothetical protein
VSHAQALDELGAALAVLEGRRLGGAIPPGVSFGSPEEIVSRLTWSAVSIWPASLGPAIRLAGNELLFEDLYAASARLGDALARPLLTGEPGNAWSKHFEATIQAAINASPWRPPPSIVALRGKHLRFAGNQITDIDAIGQQDDRLLLVSCKCRPFSDLWNKGEPKTVRNEASVVDSAVVEWADRMNKLRKMPRGDNYDFSDYRQIIGVVVFPSPPWSPTGSSVAEVLPGLRVAAGANEFGAWIRASDGLPGSKSATSSPRSRRH